MMHTETPKSQIVILEGSAKKCGASRFLSQYQSGSEVYPINRSGQTAMSKRNWCYQAGKSDVI